jgi:hypothetical protein
MIAAALTVPERDQLHGLLRRLMRAFPDSKHGHVKPREGEPAEREG